MCCWSVCTKKKKLGFESATVFTLSGDSTNEFLLVSAAYYARIGESILVLHPILFMLISTIFWPLLWFICVFIFLCCSWLWFLPSLRSRSYTQQGCNINCVFTSGHHDRTYIKKILKPWDNTVFELFFTSLPYLLSAVLGKLFWNSP